jgi:phage terminase large subunit-like protein
MGARPDAQILGITTAGVEPTSLCGRLYAYGKRIAEGEVDDDSFGFWWWEPHAEDCDIFDTDAWSQANPAMIEGILLESDLHSAALSSHPSSFRRYRLNQWVPGAGAGWMPMDRWDHAADKERKLKPGATIIILFDGSVDADATSMGVLDISDPENPHYVQVAVWEPPITGPEVENWSVPRIEVHAQLERLFREFDVRVFLGDPAWWRSEFQAWQDRFGVNKVLEWPVTNQRMGPACSEAYKRVVEQRISHDGSPTLRRHVANARVKPLPARDMYTIKKETPHSPRKIDCAVTFIMAIDGLDRFADEGPSAELLVF